MDLNVGCYCDGLKVSEGMLCVELNQHTGKLAHKQVSLQTENPSYVIATPQTTYTANEVSESKPPQLHALTDDSVHSLALKGDSPCHLAVDKLQQFIAVAHYGSGNVNVLTLDATGQPQELVADLFVEGSSVNLDRQTSPHAHQVTFLSTRDQLAVVDLGSDVIHFYQYDRSTLEFDKMPVQSVSIPAGNGPRHMVFDSLEQTAYVVCELSETLITLKDIDDEWVVVDETDLLPDQEKGEAASAIKLSPDGQFLYVSCRHQNQISIFSVEGALPKWLDSVSTEGEFPRDFLISDDGRWCVAANQNSDSLVSYKRDIETGKLKFSGHKLTVTTPVCVTQAS
ncbi:lactonase family protein [Vibrio sp. ZSDE26]|uniref:Lactonase family protein n=1 Tax=Vibrio amylolyticus TaxID=2847292 RepID=A0A9X2BI34_9VIBR|nr:lactonase family protein [Vibrio amylolyticus]MCK6264576.1 lactonase family protein [Vibrio amylolyticus]